MNARHRHKPTDEIELQQKLAELAALRARHADARAVLHRVRDEIARFESVYDQALGSRIAELEKIEAEISRRSNSASSERQRARSAFSETWEEASMESGPTDDGWTPADNDTQDLKALYREVAKTIHPDLAGPGPAKVICHELMARANRAYAEDDRRTLQEILRNWRRSPDQAEGSESGAELLRAVRQIARERREIRAVNAKVEELKASYVWRFKKRVEANLAMGIDLLANMVADADLEINRALRRLAALKGDSPQRPIKNPQKLTRKLVFPDHVCCGAVYSRDRSSISFNSWNRLGPAGGCLEIDVDQAVRLDVKGEAEVKLGHLQALQPDDLQSLFLYEIGDAELDGILHLTGLEELYLSGLRLTDDALNRISALRNLKRIYLYNTGISDEGLVYLLHLPALGALTCSGNGITEQGLAALRLATPGVKTVSFDWKR